MSLQNRTIIITGAGSGLGADAARAFLAAGARVVLNGRRSEPLLELARLDPAATAVVAGDIGDPEVGRRLVATARERFGGLDVLLNNAGIFATRPFLEVTREELSAYVNLMLGYYTLTQAAVPALRERGGDSIINIGSMWAEHAVAATPCSASSMVKGGIHALTRNLALEFAAERIRCNAVAPAVVETPLFDPLLTPEQLRSFGAFHPLGRNGQPADVTQAVLFLADEERSGWITGVVLPVDGGVTAGRN